MDEARIKKAKPEMPAPFKEFRKRRFRGVATGSLDNARALLRADVSVHFGRKISGRPSRARKEGDRANRAQAEEDRSRKAKLIRESRSKSLR
ncbi:MAG: hypothetical protein FJ280_16265 [Planctomycetes bacterium]|nr:hypothetical protein [Planctomycetota bacterium]